jgi:hypothetical protein
MANLSGKGHGGITLQYSTAKEYQDIFEGKATGRLHRITPKNRFEGETEQCRDKEIDDPAIQHGLYLDSFANFL